MLVLCFSAGFRVGLDTLWSLEQRTKFLQSVVVEEVLLIGCLGLPLLVQAIRLIAHQPPMREDTVFMGREHTSRASWRLARTVAAQLPLSCRYSCRSVAAQ